MTCKSIRTVLRAVGKPSGQGARRSERGVALIMVAILGLVLIGIVGIAMDASFILTTSQQLQRAADASSLAAARLVKSEADPLDPTNPFSLTRQAAIDIAVQNEAATAGVQLVSNAANDPNGDIVVGFWDSDAKTFSPNLTTPNAVRVRARKTAASPNGTLNLFFGKVFGTATSDVETTATAVLAPAQQALILILHPTKTGALLLNGTVTMTVNGKIHVNSTAGCGINLLGQPFKIQAVQTSVVGGACYHDGTISGTLIEGADPIPDPLAYLLPDTAAWNAFKATLPVRAGSNGSGQIEASGTYPPGYYPQGIKLQSTMTVVLDPSSNPSNPYFMFGGAGITEHGSAFVTAHGVTMFLDKGAKVDISGSGAGMSAKAPKSGPFQGVSMFHHRENTGPKESEISGGGLFQIEGLIYVPGGELVMGGVPGKEIGAIIVNTLTNAGTTGFNITGKGIPPSPGPDYTYLVE